MLGKLKQYSWALGLLIVAGLSFSGAVATNRIIAEKIRAPEKVEGLPPPGAGLARQQGQWVAPEPGSEPSEAESVPGTAPPPETSEPPVLAPAKPALSEYCIILTRNLFDSENALECPAAEKGDVEGLSGEEPAPRLAIRLFGTVSTSPPQFSWALISKDESNATSEIFRIGDDIYGMGTLRQVRRNQIVVALPDGTEVVIDLYTGDQPQSSVVARDTSSESDDQELGNSIRQLGENKYEIDSSEIQAAMNNMDELARGARIVPSYKDGNTVGFKVFRIKPNSFYKKLGLRNGDVIGRINGFEINSTEKALQLYQMLRTEKNINLEVTRRGQPMNLEYVIR